MARADIEKLIAYTNQHKPSDTERGMSYDTGSSSMVYSRGNVLLGRGRFLKSLRVGTIRRFFVDLLF